MRTFSYRTASTSLKLAITGLLLLAVVGLGVAALQVYVRTGMTPTGALLHYRGNEATLQYPKSFAEMVSITHVHAFTMPMVAFVLAAAFVATNAREWLKRLVVIALFTGMVLELGVPWLVRYGPAWSVHLFPLAGVLLFGGLVASVGLPLYEMWLSPAKRPLITVAHPLRTSEAHRQHRRAS
jgi:hypothetical protein